MRQTKTTGKYYYRFDNYTQGHRMLYGGGVYYHPYLQIYFQPDTFYGDDSKCPDIHAELLFTVSAQTEKKDDARCCGRSYGLRVEMECRYGIEHALEVLKKVSGGDSADMFTNALRFLLKKNALRIAHVEYMTLPYKFRKHAKQYAEAVKSGLMKKVA